MYCNLNARFMQLKYFSNNSLSYSQTSHKTVRKRREMYYGCCDILLSAGIRVLSGKYLNDGTRIRGKNMIGHIICGKGKK